jgi:hypothetical protein
LSVPLDEDASTPATSPRACARTSPRRRARRSCSPPSARPTAGGRRP